MPNVRLLTASEVVCCECFRMLMWMSEKKMKSPKGNERWMQDLCVWKRYFLWCFIDFSVDWSKRRKNANFPRMIYLEMPLSVTRQPTNFLWNFHKKSRPRKCLLKHFICAFPLVFYGHFPIESKVSIGNIFWFCIFQETSYTPNPQKWKKFELNSKHLSKNIQICISSVQYSLRFPSFCHSLFVHINLS